MVDFNYGKLNSMDVANGPGIRVSIFFSGCTHRCLNCFNSDLWDFHYGKPFTTDTIQTIIKLMEPEYISGLSILGGEPFQSIPPMISLIEAVKSAYPNKTIWIWTGYLFEKIKVMMTETDADAIFKNVDVIVDGPYKDELSDLTLKFKGSSNQRLIDVKKTIEKNEIVLYE
jgi:anaerobic ribonucleoside-triphosphate reductase activating protein